jgi:hypothetical protein
MRFKRKVILAMLAAALLLSAAPAVAAPAPEPLIVTKLPDPDPGFVPTREPKLVVTRSRGDPDENSLDGAMASLGQAIGQMIKVEQQAIESACKSGEPPKPGTADLYTWRARCSYQRR